MKILIDKKLEKLEFGEEETLAQVMKTIKNKAAENKRVIIGLKLNKIQLPVELNKDWLEKKVKEIKEIEVTTANPRELTIAGVLDSLKVLPQIRDKFLNVADLLAKGEQEKAMQNLAEGLEILSWFNLVVEGIEKVLGLKLSDFKARDENLLEHHNRLVQILEEFSIALHNQDWVMLGDLIEYKLIPHLKIWHEVIPEVIKELDKKLC